jgi:hypothetical protein
MSATVTGHAKVDNVILARQNCGKKNNQNSVSFFN